MGRDRHKMQHQNGHIHDSERHIILKWRIALRAHASHARNVGLGLWWDHKPKARGTPGILFVIGSLMVTESPRWLFRRGKRDAAFAALLRSRTDEQADVELAEMEQTAAAEKAKTSTGAKVVGVKVVGVKIKESLLRRKYVIPFVLACVILACNQATGVNSIIGFNTNILLQSGL